jgi:hypothetical protein
MPRGGTDAHLAEAVDQEGFGLASHRTGIRIGLQTTCLHCTLSGGIPLYYGHFGNMAILERSVRFLFDACRFVVL